MRALLQNPIEFMYLYKIKPIIKNYNNLPALYEIEYYKKNELYFQSRMRNDAPLYKIKLYYDNKIQLINENIDIDFNIEF